MVAFVGLVAMVVVIAGAGSLVLTRDSARNQATSQLVTEAQSLSSGKAFASGKNGKGSIVVLKIVRRVLKLEDARFVRVTRGGVLVTAAPPGIPASDLKPQNLLVGDTVSGRNGNLVFAAAPIQLSEAARVRLKIGGVIAVVLTRQVGDLGPSWSYFILAGGAALLIAALVAWQMSRRMVRPLIEATDVTGRIAAGDLESRVLIRDGDYTEFSSLGRSINEMAQSLQDGRGRERHLLLSVSHDLRTPLTSIRGFAEAITDGAIEDNAQAAEVIIAESRRLERLVGDLLELTKLEARQLSMHIGPTDINEVVSTTSEGFRPMAERGGLLLDVRVPSNDTAPVALVSADPDRMAQLLANLIENAITYATTSVVVSLRDTTPAGSPGGCVIAVEDDGPGIATGDLTRVFERFYQADRGPNRQIGSGLGLAIVTELAAAMGATVRAESPITANGGSRFVVTMAPQVA
jgi:two-component system sensor histidine kinase BaeS